MNRKGKGKLFLKDDPFWYKDAIIYELHVRAFYDSDADGVGDFRGLTEKLDYLQDLGVTALWLLPFYPSPLKDDGYDIADYDDIHSAYGDLRDFKAFLKEAHGRGLRVITELVVNHTSDQHPWFQRARREKPGSRWRDFYIWTDNPKKYKEARIIFKDFETSNWTWDSIAKSYYWHRFYSHQPDLNYDNPEVRKAIFQFLDFWLSLGVDGLRLDAVPYLYEREGTNCENLPETHKFLKELRRHVDKKYKNRMLLGEANQWPEDAVAYFGDGDECHMAFHFPLMPRLFIAIQKEDSFPVLDILEQTPAIPDSSQWALFLRNHDELTLEMVTDEDRDYMYRVYAVDPQARINLGIRRRLAPLLGNQRRKIELLNGILLSLPGSPVLYYGDEIGMGDNIYLGDRNGVRTPMQWSADRNAGFSRASPQKLYLPIIMEPEYHYEAINVETQQANPHSLLWWMRRILALRKQYKAFGRGSLEFLPVKNNKVLAYVRRYEDELIMVMANISRFVQPVKVDLSNFYGRVPVEMFGRTKFPRIGNSPYFITLGPHTFHWVVLEKESAAVVAAPEEMTFPVIETEGDWEEIFFEDRKTVLEECLPAYLRARRWFLGKGQQIKNTKILDTVPVPNGSSAVRIALVLVEYIEGEPDTYVIPLAFAESDQAKQIRIGAIVARLKGAASGIVYDASEDKEFLRALFAAIARRRRFKGTLGEVAILTASAFRQIRNPADFLLEPSPVAVEQNNTSVFYGERFILKLFRRIERGINPELELGRFLTEKCSFPYAPKPVAAIEYRQHRNEPMILAIVHEFAPNKGDAWHYTLDVLGGYFERVLAQRKVRVKELLSGKHPMALIDEEVPPQAKELIGSYLETAKLFGRRTAELHVALASEQDDPRFAPEPFSTLYQRSLYQSMRNLTGQIFHILRNREGELSEVVREEARKLLSLQNELFKRFRSIMDLKISAMRIRIHGDYNLKQLLQTEDGFVITDFEGDPNRPISDRRLKRSSLRDAAAMLRSFHYAVCTALLRQSAALSEQPDAEKFRPESLEVLEPWSRLWYDWVSSAFLKSYIEFSAHGGFLPWKKQELQALLDIYILERAFYELTYELNNRPDLAIIPIKGILLLLESSS